MTEPTTLDPEVLTPETAEEQAKALAEREKPAGLVAKSRADVLVITTDEQYTVANDQGREIAKKLREAEVERKRLKEPSLEGGRRIDKFFADLTAPWQAALDAIKKAMGVFERAKEAERRRLEAEAREKAAAEQRRLDALALANAQRAEDAGHHEKAEEVLANVPTVPVPVVAPLTPEVAGSYSTKRWKARLDPTMQPEMALRALARAVTEGKATPNLLLLNEVAANKLAGALGVEMKIPGVEAYQAESKTFR